MCSRRGEPPGPQSLCPECAEPMETYQRRGLELERCTRCRGVWFDAFELAEAARCALPPVSSVAPSERRCPSCEVALEQRTMGSVTVDGCRTCHGVFLDSGEYARLRRGRQPVRERGWSERSKPREEGDELVAGAGWLAILGALGDF